MNQASSTEVVAIEDLLESGIILPAFVPTIEETIKASGGHRQATD